MLKLLLPFLDVVQRKKVGLRKKGNSTRERRRAARWIYWGAPLLIQDRFYFNNCSFVFRFGRHLWSLCSGMKGFWIYVFIHMFFFSLHWTWPRFLTVLSKPDVAPFVTFIFPDLQGLNNFSRRLYLHFAVSLYPPSGEAWPSTASKPEETRTTSGANSLAIGMTTVLQQHGDKSVCLHSKDLVRDGHFSERT